MIRMMYEANTDESGETYCVKVTDICNNVTPN